jgi:hypothetical protein
VAYEVERKPGRFAKSRESSDRRIALVFGVCLITATVLCVALAVWGLSGVIPAVALLAVAYAARQFADHRLDSRIRWGKGGNAEIKVGEALELLRADGYVVMHDLDKVVPGNVDHLVSGPNGVFMVETKFKSYRHTDLPKARYVAKTIAHELDMRWVQPVVCLATRTYGPKIVGKVAVVGFEQLIPYIQSQRNQSVSFERLAAFADRQ